MTPQEISMELARALIGNDINDVRKLVLTVEAGEMPKVEVTYLTRAKHSDRLQTVVQMLELVAVPKGDK